MPAKMLAAAAGFGVSGGFRGPVDSQMGVSFERGKRGTHWRKELQTIERNQRPFGLPVRQGNQAGFEFAAQNGFDAQLAQIRVVQRRVETVATQVRRRIQAPDLLDHFHRQPRGGVHGQIECHEIGRAHFVFRQ